MARVNYNFEKRQRDLAKKKKQEQKQARKSNRGQETFEPLRHAELEARVFLAPMLADAYFPKNLVLRGQGILKDLCHGIEAAMEESMEVPTEEILALTHQATEAFNDLATAFEDQGSSLETAAREAIAEDFAAIVKAYGYDLDLEEVIAPREW